VNNNGISDGNLAPVGGGLYLDDETTTLTNVNLWDNAATMAGSAIEQTNTQHHSSLCTIQNSVFFNNQNANNTGAGIDESNGSPTLSSTITYEYSAFSTMATGNLSAPANFSSESPGGAPAILTSLGNNIASDGTGNLSAAGD